MASTVARNQQDVDQMSRKDRLYDSLSYSYGKQQEASDRSYDQAISQQDNAMLSRGMQRSSYAGAVRANMLNQKINAQNDIGYAKIADYENRLTQLEQQEKADEQWERQFAESQRQYDQGFAYQKESDDRQLAYNYLSAIAAQGGNASDDLLARAGLSRADYDLMKAQARTNGGGGGRRGNTTPTTNPLQQQFDDLQNKFDFLTSEKVYDTGGVDTLHYPTDYKKVIDKRNEYNK